MATESLDDNSKIVAGGRLHGVPENRCGFLPRYPPIPPLGKKLRFRPCVANREGVALALARNARRSRSGVSCQGAESRFRLARGFYSRRRHIERPVCAALRSVPFLTLELLLSCAERQQQGSRAEFWGTGKMGMAARI
jgi:hypothetical protein